MLLLHFDNRIRFRILQVLVSSVILLVVSFSAKAVPSCTVNSSTVTPPAPARIVVTPTVPAQKVIYEGSITANITCTGGVTGDAILMATRSVGATPGVLTSGATNVSVSGALAQSPAGPSSGYGNVVSGPCTVGIASNSAYITWTGSGTCSANLTKGLVISATATGAVSGTIPAAMTSNDPWGVAGWGVLTRCSDSACVGTTAPALLGVNGATIPIYTVSNTCTLTSAVNQTVALPKVSTASFKGVGSTSGSTNLSIVYNCPTNNVSLSMAWTFAGIQGPSPSGYSLLTNTGTATGLAVQIVDSTGAPITTGTPKLDIVNVASGVNTLRYTVRYYQNAPTVTAGSVAATATYTATFQ